ncbi:hypothetical protein [Caulobacter segnis]|nr:hypothetical protein [Caulobacter segnis]
MFEVYVNGRRTGMTYSKYRQAAAVAADFGALFPGDHFYVEEFGR